MSASVGTQRCLTVLGHVDHGKTTFVDSLLAANNIISARMAGKIRYLDSREDEQERGITMESSAISLRFTMLRKSESGEETPSHFVVNLIDTPGHVDFSSEVSSASRLCDGALVLVDVVEGVCTQTIAVLRQAWAERLRPILIVNKFDRLITELKLSPSEAYHHLVQLIENVNAVMGNFHAGDRMEDDLRWREERERRLASRKENDAAQLDESLSMEGQGDDAAMTFKERDDEDIYFAPERGNVIFASAIDGWAFRVGKFSQLYAKKLGVNEANLRKALWGDFYLDPKTKRVVSHRQLKGRNLKPLFVQFVLENIWAVYESAVMNPNPEKVAKIISSLSLKIPPRDIRTKDTRYTLQSIFSQWLSLSTCTFQTVVEIIPPPSIAQRTRLPKMLYPALTEATVIPKNKLEEDLWSCSVDEDAYIVAYVSKMFAMPRSRLPPALKGADMPPVVASTGLSSISSEGHLASAPMMGEAPSDSTVNIPESDAHVESNEEKASDLANDDEALIGFARLYSGTLTVGQTLFCLLPKYSSTFPPTHPRNAAHITPVTISALYEMMGRDLVSVQEVKAGNVFAVGGLEGTVWRNATLCGLGGSGSDATGKGGSTNTSDCLVNLAGVNSQVAPIVRVALEPEEPANMPRLIRGLKLLSQSDPCAEAFQQQTGEWVILTAGELHLERCIRDLRERFAKVEIQASKPIVPFRETAIKVAEMLPTKSPLAIRGAYSGSTAGVLDFTIHAKPLPEAVTRFLQTNVSILKRLRRDVQSHTPENRGGVSGTHADANGDLAAETEDVRRVTDSELAQTPSVSLEEFWSSLEELLEAAGSEWQGLTPSVWSFGPNHIGPNILFHRTGLPPNSLRKRANRNDVINVDRPTIHVPGHAFVLALETSIEAGFQIATFQGPLCAEPVEGMAFFVESLDFDLAQLEGESVHSKMAQIGGSLITASKEACRSGMLDWSPRLKMAIYSCDIQAPTDVLGRVYAVIARRRGRIVSEEMKEGTSFFTISAILPVVESFGFADELRKRSSGAASPQLIFRGYEILDQDPFWVPTTEEELEDLGDKADRLNIARVYMDAVRKRKGMFVDQKVVDSAEKQRTLKR